MTDLSPETVGKKMVARMIAHLRDCSEAHNVRPRDPEAQRRYDEMKAIVAELPEPVDQDVLAVRAIMHAQQRAMTPPDSGWGNMSYAKGSYDDTAQFQAALAAYRSVRP